MIKITENYESHTKEELLSEAQSRNLDGVSSSTHKADIIAALQLSDDEPKQPSAPLPKLKASKLPQIDTVPELPKDPNEAPSDEEYTDGIFAKDDGMDYAVCIREDAPNNRTHFAKNSKFFWNGTKEEFKAQFEKK